MVRIGILAFAGDRETQQECPVAVFLPALDAVQFFLERVVVPAAHVEGNHVRHLDDDPGPARCHERPPGVLGCQGRSRWQALERRHIDQLEVERAGARVEVRSPGSGRYGAIHEPVVDRHKNRSVRAAVVRIGTRDSPERRTQFAEEMGNERIADEAAGNEAGLSVLQLRLTECCPEPDSTSHALVLELCYGLQ